MRINRQRIQRSFLQIDATPLADIVFLLLIFFMLSSTFISQPGINVKLPKAKAREIQAEKQLIVTITKKSNIYVNKRRIKLENLEKGLNVLLAHMTDKVVVMRADAGVKHGLVVEVLDLARAAGAEKLAIATEKKK